MVLPPHRWVTHEVSHGLYDESVFLRGRSVWVSAEVVGDNTLFSWHVADYDRNPSRRPHPSDESEEPEVPEGDGEEVAEGRLTAFARIRGLQAKENHMGRRIDAGPSIYARPPKRLLSAGPSFTHGFVAQTTEQLINLTERCGVSTGVYGHLQAKIASWPKLEAALVTPDLLDVQGNIKSIQGHIVTELQKMRVVRLLEANVSHMLRSLHTDLDLSPTQSALRDETIRCLECGAFRSAIVMGWNINYKLPYALGSSQTHRR